MNPIKNVNVYKVSWNGAEYDRTIVVAYVGRNGVVRAFDGFSDYTLAKAGGYGYDKMGTALALAIKKLTDVELINGATGINAVMRDAEAKGISIVTII